MDFLIGALLYFGAYLIGVGIALSLVNWFRK